MNGSAYLWLFLVVLGVIVLPGLDMAFVLVSALAGGRSGGLAAVTGVVAGGICHVVMGALASTAAWPCWRNARAAGSTPIREPNAVAGRVVGAVLVCAGIFTAVNGWQAA
ncbi:MAG: Lysine exporter protein [Massilia sp.]|nr:Lysine exporter protein [Massilia sp.]